jgi:DivIVA domain-containing protein
MMWVFAIIVVLVLGGVAVVASGRGEPMARAYDDRPDTLVPADRPLGAADVRALRFTVALRGYRMSEVDALLARLASQLEQAPSERPERPELPELPERPEDGSVGAAAHAPEDATQAGRGQGPVEPGLGEPRSA